MADKPWITTPTFKPQPSPPQGGGFASSGNIFTPRTVTVKHVGTPKPTPKVGAEQAAQEYAQTIAAQRGHGIINPVASRAAAQHYEQSVRPTPQYSNAQRLAPHYKDEPVAGYVGGFRNLDGTWHVPGTTPAQPGAYADLRPYYTDENTAREGHGHMPSQGLGTLEAVGNPAQRKAVENVFSQEHPLGQAVIEGLASLIPGVPTAKRLANGQGITGGTVAAEAGNLLGLAGADEILAPVRAARSGFGAARGGSVSDAFQAARREVGSMRAAQKGRQEDAILRRNMAGSQSRQQYIKTLRDGGYTKKEQNALLALHDHVALAHADLTGKTPEEAWDRIYAHSQYDDVSVTTKDVATGRVVFAQEGERPEIQNVAATPNTHVDLPDTPGFFKRQASNLVRKHRGVLPEPHATPKKLESLLHELRQRALEAEDYKNWYEKSASAILQHVNYDKEEADKLAALIAIYSPQAKVYSKESEWNNLDRAVNAYDSFRETGEVPSHLSISKTLKRDWQTEVATQIMNGQFEWGGLKINRFYRNFLQHINPDKYAEQFGADRFGTMDSWMQKAFHYATERYTTGRHLGELKSIPAPSPKEYAFMEKVNKLVADSLGWSPEEVQAAIWTSIKAQEEGTPIEEAGFHFGDAFAHRNAREATKPTDIATHAAPPERNVVRKHTSAEARDLTPDPNMLYHETSNPEGIDAAQAIHAREVEGKHNGAAHVWLRETPYPAYGGSHVYAIPRDLVPHDLLGDRLALGNYATSGDVHFGGNAARETARVQIANEVKPGDAEAFAGDREFWNSLTPGEQASYANEVFKVTRQGQFEKIVGLDSQGHHMGIGVWRGQASLGTANHVIVNELTPKEIADLNAVASAKGIVQAQDSVSWGRPLARDKTGEGIFPGFLWRPKGATPESMADIGARIDKEFGAGWVGVTHGPDGAYYFVDFSGAENFDSRMQALLGDSHRLEPISWEGGYVEDARAAQEGAWGVTYQDAIASHPKARELQAAVAVAQEKVAHIRDDFRAFSHQRADARFEDAITEAASMLGKRIPKNGRVGSKQDRADALAWIGHEARNSTDPEVQRVADTIDQAIAARNSPDPETFFQEDNPLLDSIASAQGKPLRRAFRKERPGNYEDYLHNLSRESPAKLQEIKDSIVGSTHYFTNGRPQTNYARALERAIRDKKILAQDVEGAARPIKGAVRRTSQGEHILHLFRGADISTAVHELGHALETMLPKEIRDTLAKYGLTDEETFARSFERYFYDGTTAHEALKKPMREIATEMAKVYTDAAAIPGAKMSPAIKQQFDAFFTRESGNDPAFAAKEGAQWLAQEENDTFPPEWNEQAQGDASGNLDQVYDDAKSWLADSQWSNMEPEDFEKLTNAQVQKAVERHYEGGWDQFISDSNYIPDKPLFQQGPPDENIPPDFFGETEDTPPPANAGRPRPGELINASPEEHLRQGLRGARLRYNLQKKERSEELSERARKVEAALRSITNPDEAQAAAAAAMRGELPKIDFNGLKVLDLDALNHLKSYVQHHEALMPFQKVRLMKALDQAVEGRVPTPAEIKLIEHVFGKQTAIGIVSSTHTWGDTVINVLNIPRSLMATADLSAAVRQGLVAGASHPVMWGKAWPTMLRSFKDPNFYDKTMKEIESDSLYPLALAAHISFTDVGKDTKLIAHEEQFASDYAAQIPGVGHVVKASARAYTGFLNKIRMDLFKHQIRTAMAAGRNVNDEKFLKSIGDVVNAATGRGTIHGRAEHILPALNTLMFSPRLMLSRINYLDPTWYVRLDPAARKEALRGLFATAGAVTTAVFLASRIPGVNVGSLDPRSADFGKAKIGNTRLDLAGGFQQYIRLAARLATGESVSSSTGEVTKLGGKFGAPTRFDEIVNFAAGKAAPPVSMTVELLKGKDIAGNKVTPMDIATNFFTPLVLQDAHGIYKDQHGGVNGIMWALGGYGVGAIGIGEQTYGPKDPAKNAISKLKQEADQAGFSPPDAKILLDLEHKGSLDALSRQHSGDPQGRLNAAIDYYRKQTGDTSFDGMKDANVPDAVAKQTYETIRNIMIGEELGAYERAVEGAVKAQGGG